MIPFLALFLRAAIQFAVTFGISEIVINTVVPLINKALEQVMEFFGVPEETAKDILANEILTFVEEVGIGAATLRTKLPLKVAELLGFSTKGWAMRALTGTVATKVAAAGGTVAATAAKGAEQLAAQFVEKAAAKGVAGATGKSIGDFLMSKVGLSLGFLYVLANFLDFAAWPGSAFQGTFQAIFKIFGLNPDQSANSSKVLSTDMWNKIYNTYKTLGVEAIKDPTTGESLPFNTTNMIAVVDKIAAAIIAEKGKVTTQEMIAALQGVMILKDPVTESKINSLLQGTTTTPTGTEIKQTGTGAKIFTGVVSQGVLGTQAEFSAREDDLIESQDELQVAAQNNLALFLAALPSKARYELKIVNTVTLKDGTKRYGTTQTIITGYKKDGTAKYKTVKNKFAVLDIYIFTDRNVRSKISQIVLGPTDSVKLTPTLKTLAEMATNIQSNIVVNDTNEIEKISVSLPTQQQTTTPATTTPATTTPATTTPATTTPATEIDVVIKVPFEGKMLYQYRNSKTGATENFGFTDPRQDPITVAAMQKIAAPYDLAAVQKWLGVPITGTITTGTGTTIQIPASTNPNKCNAQSIAEFFDPNKIKYPSVDERAKLYEAFGLGKANYYTGTGEQNTKLLQELKKRVGCTI